MKRYLEKENEVATAEKTIEINLNTEENPQIVLLGQSLNKDELNELVALLKTHKDVFARSYKDMPGVDRELVQHNIPLYPDAKPVKQKLRRM